MKYLYKIVAALGALATIPTMLFSDILYYKVSSFAVQVLAFIGQIKGYDTVKEILSQNGGKLPESIADTTSVYDLYSLFTSAEGLVEGNSTSGNADILLIPAIVFAVIMASIAICAIITAVIALVVKDNRKVIYTCITGMGFSLMLNSAFDAIAEPILEETVSIASLTGAWWGGLIGKAEALSLTTNFWFVPAIFGAVILWTVLYNYTLPQNEKRERKLMLGEADEQ